MNRRGFFKSIAALFIGSSAMLALDEMTDAAGCGYQYAGYTKCSHGNWYRLM
jgi:hypothetical protein